MIHLVFWCSILMLGYTYIGYPLIIWLLARIWPSHIKKSTFVPPVTIVIVVYNEARLICNKLDNCLALAYPREKLKIMVVSDGSTDSTQTLVEGHAEKGVHLLAFSQRRGKSACINAAVAACSTDYIVFTDVRQQLAEDAIEKLMSAIGDQKVGAVSGELMFDDHQHTAFSRGIDAYWRYEKFIRHHEGVFNSVVGVTGALYGLKKSCFQPIPEGTILDDVLIPMNMVLSGKRVIFEPAAKAYDVPSRDSKRERARKLRTLAGNYQLLAIKPVLLNPFCNPIWFQLVSHKLLRLVAPVFMTSLLLANSILAGNSTSYAILLAGQIGFYISALLGGTFPRLQEVRGIRLVLTFCMLNWFAVLGFLEFIKNRKTHLW